MATCEDRQTLPELRSVHKRPPFLKYWREVIERRSFIWTSAYEEVRSENAISALGSVWLLLTPIFQIIVYWLVFGKLLDVSRGVTNYVAFLMVGILVFDLLARTLPASAQLIDRRKGLIRSVYFPRAVLPIAFSTRRAIQFAPSLIALVVFAWLTGERPSLSLFGLIPAILVAVVFMTGATMGVARVGSVAPDVSLGLPHISRLLFYGSGVLYDPLFFTSNETVLLLFDLNPFYSIISLARSAVLEGHSSDLANWVIAITWALASLTIGAVIFWRAETSYGR